MPLRVRYPEPRLVRHFAKHLVAFLKHWEMMIPEGASEDRPAAVFDNPLQDR
jgi:hypothetical protein